MKIYIQHLLRVLVSVFTLVSFIMFGAFGQNNAAIDSLENVLRTAKEDTAKVNLLNEISTKYGKIGEYKMAMQYADSALDLAKTLDYEKGIAFSHKYIGNCYDIQGKGSKALEHFLASLEIFEEIGDKRESGFIYTNIGIVNIHMGNLPEALNNIFTALKIFEEIGDKGGMIWSYESIGNIYQRMGNLPEALKHYSACLKISEEIGDKDGIAKSYFRIGYINHSSGNLEKAMEDFLAALKIYEEMGNRGGAARCDNNIGCAYWDLGNYDEAIKYFQASLKISEEIGDNGLAAYNYECLADVNIDLNNFQEARKYLDDRLAYLIEIGDKNGIVHSYIKIGKLYHQQGNYQDARKYLDDALALSKKIGSKGQIRMIYNHLSILDSDEGNFAQALEHYKMHTLYKDSLSNEENKKQTEEMLVQYEAEKKDREIELLNKDKALQEQLLEKQRLLRNGMIAGVFLIVLVGLLLFRSFRLRKKLEKQQAIMQERHRISADLHDDVGSGLSKITLLSELLKTQAKTPENRKEAEKISETALQLSSTLSEIIWALNSNNDYLENMVAYIRRYAAEYFEDSPVKLKVVTQGKILPTPINGEHRRNIFYAVKEALNNILKHAEATEAELIFVVINDKLDVIISDNGKGIPDINQNRFGNGIKNMRARMESIHGDFKIESHQGTRIILKLAI